MFVASLAKKAKNCRSNKFFNQNQIKTMILTVGYQNKSGTNSLRAKTWLIMKLTIVFLLFFTFQVGARGYAQKVTMSKKHALLSDVFKAIEQQTGFLFFYDEALLQKTEPIDITLSDATLKEALSVCLKDQPLTYTIVENTIVIQAKTTFSPLQSNLTMEIDRYPPPVTIHGRVVNKRGEPLQNVSVIIAGTKIGTTTNNEGRFTLTAPAITNLVLEISSVGFQKKTVKVGSLTEINVTLDEAVTGLNDVVVVGYGTQRKRDLTGSVSTVTNDQIESRPVSSFEDALAGLAPGIDVPPRSARPGNLSSISIRGIGSITAGYDPLFVVDGFATDAGNANSISPLDIKSVEILKDASATAIYGSRGANGVIIITTKSGRAGKTQLDVSVSTGFAKAPKNEFYKSLNGAQYVEWYKEKAAFAGTPPPNWVTNWDGISTKWQDLIYRTAPFQNYAVSASGGTDKLTFLLSGNYIDQDDILLKAGFKKYTSLARLEYKANKRISLGINLAPGYTVQTLSAPDNDEASLTGAAVFLPPIIPAYNKDGSFSDPNSFGVIASVPMANPLTIASLYKGTNKTTYLLSNIYAQIEIIDGLKLRSSFGANLTNASDNTFQPALNGLGLSSATSLNLSSAQTVNWLNENTLTYTKTIHSDHKIDFLVGYTTQKVTSNFLSGNANTFANNLGQTLGFGNTITASSDATSNTLISYLSRLNYVYKDKYLLTATIRRDGSSRFGVNNQYGVFPSVALGWNMGNESFIKNLGFVDNAKIRGSYGTTGNNQIGDFTSQGSLTTRLQSFGNQATLGYVPVASGNPNLSWEKSLKTDIGADIGLFERLNIVLDYFSNRTNGMLLEVNVPPSTGYSTNLENIGSMRNWGYEASANLSLIKGNDFSWDIGFNATHLNQKVLNLGPNTGEIQQFFGALITKVGGTLEQANANNVIGILSQKDIDNGIAKKPGDIAGDYKFQDVNKDGIISAYNGPDGVLQGSNLPKWIYGASTRVTYKNWALSALLQGQAGANVFDFVYQLYSLHIFNWNLDHFLYDGRYISASDPGNGHTPRAGFNDVGAVSSWEMQSTDFLRIRNVNLAYNFSKKITDRLFINGLKAFISIENLYTFTKFRGGNPQAIRYNIGGAGGVVRLVGDGRTLSLNSTPTAPIPRVFTFGINFSL